MDSESAVKRRIVQCDRVEITRINYCVGGLRFHHGLDEKNEAEYMVYCCFFYLLANLEEKRVLICADSNLVIRQMRGEIDCKAPGLQWLNGKLSQITSFYI